MFFVPSEVCVQEFDDICPHNVPTITEDQDEENNGNGSSRVLDEGTSASPSRPGFDPNKYIGNSSPQLARRSTHPPQQPEQSARPNPVKQLSFRSTSQIRRMLRKNTFDEHSVCTLEDHTAEGETSHLLESKDKYHDCYDSWHAPRETHEHDETEEPMDSWGALKDIFFKYLNLLLILVPFGWASHHFHWNDTLTFWLNFFAIIPLASILGDFTEELACHTNQVVGGLINATFGNAVELVVAIQALMKNEIRLVQATMIGSILSNLLLVLGCCFLFGGLKYKEQSFNTTATTANLSLLALSSVALVVPAPFAEYYDIEDSTVLSISRGAAVFLILMYAQLLVFQMKTHAYLMEDDSDDAPSLPFIVAFTGLASVTFIIAVLSDYLVDSVDGFTEQSGISRTFVGLVILPIVGNVVEHLTAVMVAMKDKMDLAVSIAVGSSTQISLFVIPAIVLTGWVAGRDMTLNFPPLEIVLYVLAVVVVHICLGTGKSHWLLGSLLTTTYFMVAVGFWFERVEPFEK